MASTICLDGDGLSETEICRLGSYSPFLWWMVGDKINCYHGDLKRHLADLQKDVFIGNRFKHNLYRLFKSGGVPNPKRLLNNYWFLLDLELQTSVLEFVLCGQGPLLELKDEYDHLTFVTQMSRWWEQFHQRPVGLFEGNFPLFLCVARALKISENGLDYLRGRGWFVRNCHVQKLLVLVHLHCSQKVIDTINFWSGDFSSHLIELLNRQ